jgi:putative ABC transport system ATP-binding protein
MSEATVTCTGVVVRFGATTALGGVDLVVRAGELVAVTGHSGAGKSTLLSVLAGIVRPDEGTVHIRGRAVDGLEGAVAAGVCVVPQGNGLAAVLSAHENVLLPLLARGADPGDVDSPDLPFARAQDSVVSRPTTSSGSSRRCSPFPCSGRTRG